MKRLFVLLVMTTLPLLANAYDACIDGIYYNLSEDEAIVTNNGFYGRYYGNVIIPEEISYEEKTYKVTRIENQAFKRCSNMTGISIPNSVKLIGKESFEDCTGLTSLFIPNGVTSIGYSAFWGCTNLEELDISDSVENIGNSAFGNTAWFFKQPDGVVYAGKVAYTYKGENPINISIKEGTIGIAEYAFYNSPDLYSISLPNSIKVIGACAFAGCKSLSSIDIPGAVKTINEATFDGCYNLSNVTLHEGLVNIGNSAFSSCGLKSIAIPQSVELIDFSFTGCSELNAVYISNLSAWCRITFYGDLTFPGNPLYYAHHLYYNGEEITDLVIPNDITTINNNTFVGCQGLKSVQFHDNISSIGNNSFSGCTNIEVVSINNGCMRIGDNAFSNCSHLQSVDINSGCLTIGDFAFSKCSNLKNVDIPNTITTIGKYAFEGCKQLSKLKLPDSLNVINKGLFWGCTTLKTINIPLSIEVIYQEAFGQCYALSYIEVFPDEPPFIYDDSFANYAALVKVPTGKVETYKSAQGWKNFANINDSYIYKLTYIVDNDLYKVYEVEYYTPITPEPEPEKEGYTFSGWSEIPATMPARDVTVTGSFTVNKYKLSYKVDGQVYKTTYVEYGTTITPEPAPAMEGYTFSGWSEIPATMPAHDVTVTGSFTVNKYPLTYIVDGQEYKTYEVEYGAAITPEAEPTKEGYTFSGWSEIPATMPAHVVIVTGTFTANKYKLTYLLNGEIYKQLELEFGTAITPEPAIEQEGHTFSGWSEIPATMPAHNVTVTGTLTVNKYILTYILDGREYKTFEVEYGTAITPEPEPEKEGYTFNGWIGLPETMPARLVIVTGTFSINSYTLTYMIDEVVYKQVMYEYGATITPEPQPEGDYVSFEWVGVPETMPAHDVTVTAVYETGIAEIMMMAQQGQLRIYSPNGKKLDKLQKGLNIVVMQDGTTRKVVTKSFKTTHLYPKRICSM